MTAARVFMVCASLSRASTNRSALSLAHRAVIELGAEAVDDEVFDQIPPLDPDLVDRPGAAVATFRHNLATADAVIIAAPEYAGSLAGNAKNALDWVVGSGELYNKPVGILSAGTTGGPFARQVMAQTLLWQGAHLVAQLGIAAPRTKSDAAGSIIDPWTVAAIAKFAWAVVNSVNVPIAERARISSNVAASVGVRRDVDTSSIATFAGFD